jgi:hypothetical protein
MLSRTRVSFVVAIVRCLGQSLVRCGSFAWTSPQRSSMGRFAIVVATAFGFFFWSPVATYADISDQVCIPDGCLQGIHSTGVSTRFWASRMRRLLRAIVASDRPSPS